MQIINNIASQVAFGAETYAANPVQFEEILLDNLDCNIISIEESNNEDVLEDYKKLQIYQNTRNGEIDDFNKVLKVIAGCLLQ